MMPMTITSSTTAVAYVLSMCRPSLESTYMCTERVRTESNRPPPAWPGIYATEPAVYISAADSPTTRPMAKITPDKMPGTALGSTM